jgi:ribonuclease HII
MEQIHHQFSQYGWNENKGYATKRHRDAIAAYGISPHHRKSFRLYPDLLLFGD